MTFRGSCLALAGLVVLAAPAARAHELVCDKQVNGRKVVVVRSYPATLDYDLTVKNVHPQRSEVLEASDPLLENHGFSFDPPAPFWLDTDEQVTNRFQVRLDSYEECVAFARGADDPQEWKRGEGQWGNGDSNGRKRWWNRLWGNNRHEGKGGRKAVADNTFTVGWDSGSLECRARVICKKGETPPPDGHATRTMGFFKNRPAAVEACVDAGGSIDLGLFSIDGVESGLGLLHGSVPFFEDRTRRSDLEQKRFLLARQLFVAVCNVRLFGTQPTPPDLLSLAGAALCGEDEGAISDFNALVDAFNNSADDEDIPYDFGPARPQQARQLADGNDPTALGQTCPNGI